MKNSYLKKAVSFLFILISNLTYSQSNEIKVKFIGNCGLYLTDGNLNIYVDFPYKSGAFGYMDYDVAEIDSIKENSVFIFTHKHPDHYSGKNIRKTLREKNGEKYGKWNVSKLENLKDTIADFSIEVFENEHRFSFKHYSYMITWHGKKIFLSGDTETADTILEQTNMDWAFVPKWVVLDAMDREAKIDAKKIGIYHLYPTEIIKNSSPDKFKVLDTQGEIISIPY